MDIKLRDTFKEAVYYRVTIYHRGLKELIDFNCWDNTQKTNVLKMIADKGLIVESQGFESLTYFSKNREFYLENGRYKI